MTTRTSEEHNSAAQRMHASLVEQQRLDDRYQDAIGTMTEQRAYAQLRAAGDQVAALEAWIHWVDDETYHGLNAGPFELLAESSDGDRSSEGPAASRAYPPSEGFPPSQGFPPSEGYPPLQQPAAPARRPDA